MSKIRDALSSLPAKPALVIAPLLVVIVLSLYYRDQYQKCTDIRQTRAALNERLHAAETGTGFRLADFTGFSWSKVRIVSRVEPGTISNECPFEWNWARGQRESLLSDGLLSALIFGHSGKVVGYLELRRDEVDFSGAEGELTPDTAVFSVESAAAGGGGVRLIRQR